MSDISKIIDRENLKIASVFKRAIAMTIDDFLISFLVIISFFDTFSKAKSFEEMMLVTNKVFIYILIAYTLYHWIFVALYGKTIGKMITKTRVIDIKTLDNPNWYFSLIRSLVRNFDEMFFYAGMMVAFFDPYNRALHDIAGRCIVVED